MPQFYYFENFIFGTQHLLKTIVVTNVSVLSFYTGLIGYNIMSVYLLCVCYFILKFFLHLVHCPIE